MNTPRISHHLLLCATPTKAKCCDPEIGAASWSELKRVVKQLGLEDPGRPEGVVLRSKADCLRICERGPVLLIWPEGIWYASVTPEKIEPIVQSHVINKTICEEWTIKTTPFQASPQH
ncbi:MAG: ferredoxin [Cyanobium sp. NAT70]|nr:ferredoxin [Cyanobium sp. NAT70]|tara:strand:+ start:96 stop:449 length:354 start_codon:yes stop_codon:yes gene_type:complete